MTRKLLLGNCLDHLRIFADDRFKATITSPPYNMNLRIRNGKTILTVFALPLTTRFDEIGLMLQVLTAIGCDEIKVA